MTVAELMNELKLDLLAGEEGLNNKVETAYVGDLLSWVMGRAKPDCAWITIMGHINIIAVAELVGAACIILAEGSVAAQDTLEKANSEGIPILACASMNSYEISGRLRLLNI